MKAIILAVGAGLCWGIGEVLTKSVLHTGRIGPLTAIAVRSTIALPLLWVAYAVVTYGLKTEPRTWTSAGSASLFKLAIGSGVIAGAFGMILFYASLSLGEISRVKPIAFTIAPATAVLLGALVFGEPLGTRKIVALVMILTGVVLLTGRASGVAAA